MIKDVLITRLNKIETFGGDVMHAIKESSPGYSGFGEAYFSKVNQGAIKAWKRHNNMTLNLIVPVGKVKFVMFDDRDLANTQLQELVISDKNYCRLTIPPKIWVGFQGLSKDDSVILNVANIEHDSSESDQVVVDNIEYDWSINR
jgi:dTDP-4-dehydrorhamnose 3,5-epimerase